MHVLRDWSYGPVLSENQQISIPPNKAPRLHVVSQYERLKGSSAAVASSDPAGSASSATLGRRNTAVMSRECAMFMGVYGARYGRDEHRGTRQWELYCKLYAVVEIFKTNLIMYVYLDSHVHNQ